MWESTPSPGFFIVHNIFHQTEMYNVNKHKTSLIAIPHFVCKRLDIEITKLRNYLSNTHNIHFKKHGQTTKVEALLSPRVKIQEPLRS